MKRFIAILMTLCLVLCMSGVSVWAATIGQQLPDKEVGWERYDDNNPYIQYKDFTSYDVNSQITGSCGYGGTASLNESNSTTGEVKFKFIGTQFRLICNTGNYRTSEAHVYIDNKPYTFSCSQIDGANTLVFECEELNNLIHEVIIKEFKPTGNTTRSTFGITAIDIKGKLVAPENLLAKLSVFLNTGETVQLSTSYDLDNNYKKFAWSSTNEAVATVDRNGKVTAVAEGTADIYAQNADGTFKEYIPVKVVEGIADELRLAVHLKVDEKAKLYLTDDPSQVTWSSMDDSITTVSADGQVTGVEKGLAIVKAELDGQTHQIYVRVNG